MKASEAEPLTPQEMSQLKSLFQRWVLLRYPVWDGSSKQSDAIQTYDSVRKDADSGETVTRQTREGDEEVEL